MSQSKSPPNQPRKLRLWLIEDDEEQEKALRDLLRDALQHNADQKFAWFGADLDVDPQPFRKGSEAIVAMEQGVRPDIILADVLTPGPDEGGVAVFHWLEDRTKIAPRDRPLLVLTSAAREHAEPQLAQTREADWVGFIPKPKVGTSLPANPSSSLLPPDHWLANLAWVVFSRRTQEWRNRFDFPEIAKFDFRATSTVWKKLWGDIEFAANQPLVIVDGATAFERAWIAAAIHARSKRPSRQMRLHLPHGPWLSVQKPALFGPDSHTRSRGLLEYYASGTLFLESFEASSEETSWALLELFKYRARAKPEPAPFFPGDSKEPYHFNGAFILGISDAKAWFDSASLGGVGGVLRDHLRPVMVTVPPLSQLKEDIADYAALVLQSREPSKSFALEAQEVLKAYSWPGDYSELHDMVKGLSVFKSDYLARDLPFRVEGVVLAPKAEPHPIDFPAEVHVSLDFPKKGGLRLAAPPLIDSFEHGIVKGIEPDHVSIVKAIHEMAPTGGKIDFRKLSWKLKGIPKGAIPKIIARLRTRNERNPTNADYLLALMMPRARTTSQENQREYRVKIPLSEVRALKTQ